MPNSNNRRLAIMAIICALGASGVASAQMSTSPAANAPSAVNETQGATSGLGSSHRFASVSAAQAHCSNDTVVWSSGPNLIYLPPGAANYGKGHGFYACKAEADDAGFHAAGSN